MVVSWVSWEHYKLEGVRMENIFGELGEVVHGQRAMNMRHGYADIMSNIT